MAVNTEMVEMWERAEAARKKWGSAGSVLYLMTVKLCDRPYDLNGFLEAHSSELPYLTIPLTNRRLRNTRENNLSIYADLQSEKMYRVMSGIEGVMGRRNSGLLEIKLEDDGSTRVDEKLTGVLAPNKQGSFFDSSGGSYEDGSRPHSYSLHLRGYRIKSPESRFIGQEPEQVARYIDWANHECPTLHIAPLDYHSWLKTVSLDIRRNS